MSAQSQLGDKGQLQTGTTRVTTMSTSLDAVPQCECSSLLQLAAIQIIDFDPWTLTYVLKDLPSHHHFLHHLGLERTGEGWDPTAFLSQ